MIVVTSTTVRNAMLDAVETAVGTSPVLKIISGTIPATTAETDAGTVLATISLPSDWAAAASAGSKALSGTPLQDTSADNTGDATHWRLFDSSGTCHLQGDITATGGGGSLTLANTSLTLGGLVQVTSGTIS